MSLDVIIDLYCKAWSQPDPHKRLPLLNQSVVAGVVYIDPTIHLQGSEGLSDHIAGVLATRPGARIERTSTVNSHHDRARFHWQLVMPDGATLPEGLDIVTIDRQSLRLIEIVGFFGPLR